MNTHLLPFTAFGSEKINSKRPQTNKQEDSDAQYEIGPM